MTIKKNITIELSESEERYFKAAFIKCKEK